MYGDKWIDSTKKFHITSKFVSSLKEGQQIRVVMLDRNFCDYLWNLTKEGYFKDKKPEKPSKILNGRHYHGIYIHNSKLKGKMKFVYKGSENNEKFRDNFEFDVEYKTNYWYPLKHGKLNINCDCGKKYMFDSDYYIMKNVRVGRRGPMILEDDVHKLPLVFLN